MVSEKNNVLPLRAGEKATVSSFEKPPAHLKTKVQKAAWDDLVSRVEPAKLTNAEYFTFEMAATLVAKFREGKAMNATEHKEMKRLLIQLGLAKPDDDGPKPKKKKNDHYFDQ